MNIVKEYPRKEVERVQKNIRAGHHITLLECVVYFCPINIYKYQIIIIENGTARPVKYRKTLSASKKTISNILNITHT